MIAIIKAHNRLNGLIFSIAEFAVIALTVGAFATYYLVKQQAVYAAISWGITLNCLPVVIFGLLALVDDERKQHSRGSIWNKAARQKLIPENPHMLQDTLVLTVATLLPFVTVAVVLYELVRARLARHG